jgi:hypothetical protein
VALTDCWRVVANKSNACKSNSNLRHGVMGLAREEKHLYKALRLPLTEAETKKALENIGRFKATLELAINAEQTWCP